MVLGITSIVTFTGFLLGIPAIILGIIALKKGAGEKGMSIAGIITGAISTFISLFIVGIMLYIFIMIGMQETQTDYQTPDRHSDYSYPRSSSSSEL